MSTLLSQLPAPPLGKSGWPWDEETPLSAYGGKTRWPRISIVTPSFNQGAYIEETIRSILLQNYPNLNFVVMDGGSSDDTVAILKKYSPWMSHWESNRDRGQSHAINKGLDHCDGEWFNWINSDDCLLPGALAVIGGVSPDFSIIAASQTTGLALTEAQALGRTRIAPTLEDTLINHFICQQGLFMSTDLVKSLHGVREELHYVMDLDLFSRGLLVKGLGTVQEITTPVAFFRRHEQAKTAIASEKFFHEERRLFSGLGSALGLDPVLLRHVAAPADALPALTPVSRLDKQRLSEALALKFWWEGPVEKSWLSREFSAFKHELNAFRHAFPGLANPRISRLSFLARLPNPLLRLLSRFRSS